ncbi:arylsulfatase A isoform X1 [Rhinoderma darwinii]|uniref:arylsulfatase A isoform X1 n=1 Tax=Rhinoderma darwinii TaxID=43563 RepID=UPI003F67C1FF
MTPCTLLIFGCLLHLAVVLSCPPNIILIFADDLGYGDLGCYGHPTSRTPNLDVMAARGLRFTDFYTTGAVCSPSRSSLLTGRFQTRTGVYPGVFFPSSVGGLPLSEVTIAEMLQSQGYVTAMAGKWHLGLGANGTFLPTRQGFQHYLGVPYSHDQGPCQNLTCFPPNTQCYGTCDLGETLLPVFLDEKILQQPVNFTELVPLYEQFSKKFIRKSVSQKKPFFLYYASHHTHYPQFASARYTGHSRRGKYGDALLELDGTVGELAKSVWEMGIQDNTLIIFTSDNGPETMRKERGGSSGHLKCGKSTTYEGGLREPAIMYWEGKIKPGVTSELASTLDILPTVASLAGAPLPKVTLDGYDLSKLLLNGEKSPRSNFYYYPPSIDPTRGIHALRMGKYKAHFYTQGAFHSETTPDPDCHITALLTERNPPLLFDLDTDPAENYNLLERFIPKELEPIVNAIQNERERFLQNMTYAESEINKGKDPSLRPCCNPACTPKPKCCRC